MTPRSIKKALQPLRHTPFHPQWQPPLKSQGDIFSGLSGQVLDIGCAESSIQQQLPSATKYIGLDYYKTATEWYQTRPDVFGDGQKLPFSDQSFDHVLLLDVLEHIPAPSDCLEEVRRVLKPGGTLIIQVPFLYPIHDAPLDFQRWTEFGLKRLAKQHGFLPLTWHIFCDLGPLSP